MLASECVICGEIPASLVKHRIAGRPHSSYGALLREKAIAHRHEMKRPGGLRIYLKNMVGHNLRF
jgi:hypothetical protein